MNNVHTPSGLVRQFFLGFVRLHILHHASEGSVCGVDLSAELGRHGYKLSPGTLYPILHGLEAAGYLHHRDQVEKGRQRKVYALTRKGQSALDHARKHLKELVEELMEAGSDHAKK
jgi:PadR family transcriptional regulator, regulatory protein PadR